MAQRQDDKSLLQRLREMGEGQLNEAISQMMSSPRFADAVGNALQAAMQTKGRVDRNMQTILGLLNLPSRTDYKKLATKVEALQGSLVNLNIKLDRILAAQQKTAEKPKKDKPRTVKAQAAGSAH